MDSSTTAPKADLKIQAGLSRWEEIQTMSNEALDEAVHSLVWGATEPESEEDLLLSELLNRFEGMAGIVRDESGEIPGLEDAAELGEAMEYAQQCVNLAQANDDEFVVLRTERMRDVLSVAAGRM